MRKYEKEMRGTYRSFNQNAIGAGSHFGTAFDRFGTKRFHFDILAVTHQLFECGVQLFAGHQLHTAQHNAHSVPAASIIAVSCVAGLHVLAPAVHRRGWR